MAVFNIPHALYIMLKVGDGMDDKCFLEILRIFQRTGQVFMLRKEDGWLRFMRIYDELPCNELIQQIETNVS